MIKDSTQNQISENIISLNSPNDGDFEDATFVAEPSEGVIRRIMSFSMSYFVLGTSNTDLTGIIIN